MGKQYQEQVVYFGQTVLPVKAPSQAQLLLASVGIWYESKVEAVEAQQCFVEKYNHNYSMDFNWRFTKSISLLLVMSIAVWWLNCLD